MPGPRPCAALLAGIAAARPDRRGDARVSPARIIEALHCPAAGPAYAARHRCSEARPVIHARNTSTVTGPATVLVSYSARPAGGGLVLHSGARGP